MEAHILIPCHLPMLLYNCTHLYGMHITYACSYLLIFLPITGFKYIFYRHFVIFNENLVLFL